MPNGGPDCCGNCGYNKAVQEMAHPHPDRKEEFWNLSHCTLRQVRIPDPFWTYCENFLYGKEIPEEDAEVQPKGYISGSGLFEGYVRIPWNDTTSPKVSVPSKCAVCGRETLRGITVQHEDAELGFCTNRHYIDWWKTIHDDPSVSSEGLITPEERFEETR